MTGTAVEGDGRNKRLYELTAEGRRELHRWLAAPVTGVRLRDELFVKLILVATGGAGDARGLIRAQRREFLQALRDVEDARAETRERAASLVLDGAALRLRADLEWLDLCEQRLFQGGSDGSDGRG